MYQVVLVAAVLVGAGQAFYLPGLAPVNYCQQGIVDDNKCQVSHVMTRLQRGRQQGQS